jgi:hypothetical protein
MLLSDKTRPAIAPMLPISMGQHGLAGSRPATLNKREEPL